MKKYYIGMRIDGYYSVHIIEDGYETKELVKEENLKGFIQCLQYFGFRNWIWFHVEAFMDKKDIIEELISKIEHEIECSYPTRYVCEDGSIISTSVGSVDDWFKEYKHVLREKYCNWSSVLSR